MDTSHPVQVRWSDVVQWGVFNHAGAKKDLEDMKVLTKQVFKGKGVVRSMKVNAELWKEPSLVNMADAAILPATKNGKVEERQNSLRINIYIDHWVHPCIKEIFPDAKPGHTILEARRFTLCPSVVKHSDTLPYGTYEPNRGNPKFKAKTIQDAKVSYALAGEIYPYSETELIGPESQDPTYVLQLGNLMKISILYTAYMAVNYRFYVKDETTLAKLDVDMKAAMSLSDDTPVEKEAKERARIAVFGAAFQSLWSSTYQLYKTGVYTADPFTKMRFFSLSISQALTKDRRFVPAQMFDKLQPRDQKAMTTAGHDPRGLFAQMLREGTHYRSVLRYLDQDGKQIETYRVVKDASGKEVEVPMYCTDISVSPGTIIRATVMVLNGFESGKHFLRLAISDIQFVGYIKPEEDTFQSRPHEEVRRIQSSGTSVMDASSFITHGSPADYLGEMKQQALEDLASGYRAFAIKDAHDSSPGPAGDFADDQFMYAAAAETEKRFLLKDGAADGGDEDAGAASKKGRTASPSQVSDKTVHFLLMDAGDAREDGEGGAGAGAGAGGSGSGSGSADESVLYNPRLLQEGHAMDMDKLREAISTSQGAELVTEEEEALADTSSSVHDLEGAGEDGESGTRSIAKRGRSTNGRK